MRHTGNRARRLGGDPGDRGAVGRDLRQVLGELVSPGAVDVRQGPGGEDDQVPRGPGRQRGLRCGGERVDDVALDQLWRAVTQHVHGRPEPFEPARDVGPQAGLEPAHGLVVVERDGVQVDTDAGRDRGNQQRPQRVS